MEKEQFSNKLPIGDDLSFDKIHIPKLPTDILFPEELNRYLRNQIQEFQHENEKLKMMINDKGAVIKDRETRIRNLENKLKQYQHFTSLGSVSGKSQISHADLATTKIVELSKKIRELNAEIEKYRTQVVRLENRVKELTFEDSNSQQTSTSFEKDKKEENPDQIKLLSDKLAATSKKLFETKNQNIQLTNELKQANRLLAQEIGENFTSISSLAQNSNWRGRAQQILSLQQKLNEYQDKLSLAPMEKEISNSTFALRQIESNKRLLQEQLTKDLTTTKSQLDETKKKLDGSRARSKILENDAISLRGRLNTLLEKSQHDDELIKALKNEINLTEEKYKDKLTTIKQQADSIQEAYTRTLTELNHAKEKQTNFQQLLTERENKIAELKLQIQEYTNNGNKCLTNIGDIKIDRETIKNEQEQKAVYRAAEAERTRLLRLISNINSRLDSVRNQFDEVQLELKREKHKTAKLEVKCARFEKTKAMLRPPDSYSKSNLLKATSAFVEKNDMIEELKNKLEISEEQILLLKSRVAALQEEKSIDLENYNVMIENIKKVFEDEKKPKLAPVDSECPK